LVEVVVVTAIVGLLAALVFGVAREARREGNRASATSDGRQLYLAMSLYSEQAERWHHGPMDDFVASGHLADARLLRAPTDNLPLGYGGEILRRATLFRYDSRHPVSWETHFRGSRQAVEAQYDQVSKFDDNPGVLALRVLGTKNDLGTRMGANLVFLYSGPMIRVRRDGSVERADYPVFSYPGSNGELGGKRVCVAYLFTDVRNSELCRRD
jgi:hypothetical protein